MSQKHSALAVGATNRLFKELGLTCNNVTDEERPEFAAIIDREAVKPAQADLLEAVRHFIRFIEMEEWNELDALALERETKALYEILPKAEASVGK